MNPHGKNYIGFQTSAQGSKTLSALNPATGDTLEGAFHGATLEEIDRACALAQEAFENYSTASADTKADFLDAIAEEILNLGDALIQRACAETGLPEARITGERGRTMNQLKMFAQLVREGSWKDARIDTAIPDRQPPKPDLRKCHVALGPVVVFGASNFPLAFSTAGGDTASAFAAGCPVIVKAHKAHPGTGELVGSAIIKAAKKVGLPEGIFSMVHSTSYDIGMALVKDPRVKAVGFTGSTGGGRALFDAAASRPEPIPVYAEMGSSNPVFLLPGAAKERGEDIATGLKDSINLGVGQFCTGPGILASLQDEAGSQFTGRLKQLMADASPGTMALASVKSGYDASIEKKLEKGVELLAKSARSNGYTATCAQPALLQTGASNYLEQESLEEEIFGPGCLSIACDSKEEMLRVAKSLRGHLTATVHGTEEDLEEYRDLLNILQQKVGRLIINGFPTGVEVCPSMNHGGPYPSATDAHFTSVGTAAIYRFARPVCYQNFPDRLLPAELRNANPLNIWRMVNGEWTKEAVEEKSGVPA